MGYQQFEKKLEACLSSTAVKTKFAAHTARGRDIVAKESAMLGQLQESATSKRNEQAITRKENKSGSICGTPNYIAPEVLHTRGHSTASEVWSVGCMSYALLCGAPPFETESVNSTYARITQGFFNVPPHLSTMSSEFIQGALVLQPNLRASVRSQLSHPFLAGLEGG